ncbi:MAG: dual specificity protein phosphatase family protein [Candidatus Microgenomates bacterium]|jgi:protein-tyrosine phosphatase
MKEDHVSDYSQITDQIFIGSDLCKGLSCPIHGPEFEKLGILVELNLSVEKKETPPDGIDIYAWIPVADKHAPSPEQLDIGTSIINEAVMNGKRIYIHCKNGHGRAPTMVAAYFIRFQGKIVDEAVAMILHHRNEVHLEFDQREALGKFEEKYNK